MISLIINPRTGVSGDMFIGALIGLGINITPAKEFLEGLADIEVSELKRGYRVQITTKLHHLDIQQALEYIDKARSENILLENGYRIARKIIEVLYEAEENVHRKLNIGHKGKLHEASDIIIDAIISAFGLQQLKINEIYCIEPVYTGFGVIKFSHGIFEVPAPATRYIIEKYDIPIEKGNYDTELLTPTGAAILAAIDPIFIDKRDFKKFFEPISTGVGYGSKKLREGNYLELHLARKKDSMFIEEIVELETNLDDVTPEIIGNIFDSIRDALDIQIIGTIGKKNRPSIILKVWCYKDDERDIVNRMFRATGTLGIRRKEVERYVKPRDFLVRKVRIGNNIFRVRFKGGKPEFRDLKRISERTGLEVLEIYKLLMSGDTYES